MLLLQIIQIMRIETRPLIIAGLALLLAEFGGLLAFTTPALAVGLLALLAWGGLALGSCRQASSWPMWPAVAPLVIAFGLAGVVNGMSPLALVRLGEWALALALLAVVYNWFLPAQVLRGLYIAAWLYPVLFWFGWQGENTNIRAVWPVVFGLVAGYHRRWLLAGVYVVMLVELGSRGAILGAVAGMFVLTWPVRLCWLAAGASAAVAVGSTLTAWRPVTAANRLSYWQDALSAWRDNPVWGVGPGGLYIGQLIPEPGGLNYQEHAHNILISWLATTGLIGVVALAVTFLVTFYLRPHAERWALAIMAALLAHSMVDEPLWWPGPLLLAAIVASTIRSNNENNAGYYPTPTG